MEYTRAEAKTWAKNKLKGFYDAPFTPMTTNHEIDEPQLRKNLEAYMATGLEGLVVGGFIAECWNITYKNWVKYHEIVADVCKGRIPIWTIILDSSVFQALEKLELVENLGYDGAEMMNPAVQLKSDDEIFDYFKYVTDHSNLAVFLYRTPLSGKVLPADLVMRLADLETIVGVKQGSFSRADTLSLRHRIRNDFIISEPMERFFFDDLREGGQVLWAAFWYLAFGKKRHHMRAYYDLALQGKWEEARASWKALEDIRYFFDDLAQAIAGTGTYATHLAMMKPWMEAIGFPCGALLPPVRPTSPEKAEWLRGELKALGVC